MRDAALFNTSLNSNQWIERAARWGFSAKGFVYVLVGIMAVLAAIGQKEKSADKNGVAQFIFEQPFGQFLAVLVIIGLIGYVVWRFVEAIQDPHHRGSDAKGMARRIGYAISGLLYAVFAFSLIKRLTGQGNSGGNSQQGFAAKLLSTDWGPFLLAAIGITVMVIGFRYLYKAYKNRIAQKLNIGHLQYKAKETIVRIGRIGYAARGIVWLLIGFFALRAGLTSNAGEVKGSEGAFRTIEQATNSWVLLIVALGVVAYGVFMFVKARYYQVKVH